MSALLQIIGALLVLAGFAAAQLGWLRSKSPLYLSLNLLGSALLAGLALQGHEWGFLLLEGVWALVSALSLGQVLRHDRSGGERPAGTPA